MADYVNGTIDLPPGKKPILLTFDDSSPGQFRYLIKGGSRIIDPDCAVGMMVQFHEKHTDFPLHGVFYVLPEARQPHKLFGQPEYEGDKLRELDRLGFEIGNHTLWHARLDKYDDTVVQKQLALAQEAIRRFLPGYTMRSLALPLGMYPKNSQLAVEGSYHGLSYHNDADLLVAGPPAPSPFSTACDLKHLPRIQVPGSELAYWLRYLERHPDEVYRSDGKRDEVSFPRALLPKFNKSRFSQFRINTH
jgi:peptidoglycan/xylan/chitin deacetylase (PgdA/CDA1 family)